MEAMLVAALKDLDAASTKEIETAVVAVRNDKVKAEKKKAEDEKKAAKVGEVLVDIRLTPR